MSEITRGVISMPFEMAMGSELSRRQFHSIAQSLLIERDLLLLCVNKWEEAAIQREADRDQLRAELAGLRTGFDAQNKVIEDLERARIAGFDEYDFSLLKGRKGDQKVFEITIETECGCDIEEGEYTVRITHLLGNWLGSDDFGLIEEAVAEIIADLNLPEEGHTAFIAYESGECQDVFWTKWFEIATVSSVLPLPDAAMGKGVNPKSQQSPTIK
ncbi:hypothetical protein PEQA60_21760 [Pseudomonas sp. Eqa60]|uniref:hypothetical protein n=1 Tax=Pseudomonas sp. Eqa60 TaxID=2799184 RepID=UPI001BB3EA35|nr:hypothetical protein [Pseudomonas sp. Eqa60]BCQ68186.1 hypothetical protein PEQA60_21760 [Pseudomonas sp. Eqa60]